ncbi:MAG: HNH endonuclease family protein [Desulfuromonas sp.]
MVFRIFAVVVLGGWVNVVLSHGGGLDHHGGHWDRASGSYHCHRSSCTPPQRQMHLSEVQPDPQPRFSTLYDRREWPHWIDSDGDCQDTRAEVLIQTSEVAVKFKRNRGCNVSHGRWTDPYTDRTFTRAADLDIDHLVPLAWAHGHGGSVWSRERKRLFANDPANLQPVEASINREKGSRGPDDWLPPNRGYHCQYLSRFVGIVRNYQLRLETIEVQRLKPLARRCQIRL